MGLWSDIVRRGTTGEKREEDKPRQEHRNLGWYYDYPMWNDELSDGGRWYRYSEEDYRTAADTQWENVKKIFDSTKKYYGIME